MRYVVIFGLILFYFCYITPAFIASLKVFCNFDNVLLWCAEYKVGARQYKLFSEKHYFITNDSRM